MPPRHHLYACLTSLDTLRIPSTLRPVLHLHLGPGVWGAAGGVYRRVDGDLLAWMAQTLDRQDATGDVDSEALARSVDFLHSLTAIAAEHGITPSAAPPEGFQIRFEPPRYRTPFLTQ